MLRGWIRLNNATTRGYKVIIDSAFVAYDGSELIIPRIYKYIIYIYLYISYYNELLIVKREVGMETMDRIDDLVMQNNFTEKKKKKGEKKEIAVYELLCK